MWTLIMKLLHTEVKSQIGLSSLRVLCKRARNELLKLHSIIFCMFETKKEGVAMQTNNQN